MSGRADYRLRHGVFGMLGSFWNRQLDAASKDQARTLSVVSSSAERLQRLDSVVNYLSSSRRVTVEDATFKFVDGDFCYVGQDFLAYVRTELDAPDGSSFTFSRRDVANIGSSDSTQPRPNVLAALSAEFVATAADAEFSPVSDVFLLPIPRHLTPVLIASRLPGVTLVGGVDFTAYDGYIAMRDNPAEVLTPGYVSMPLAILNLSAPNSYTLRADGQRYGNTFLANYDARAQSPRAFKQAAAEYAGLWVIEEDDSVLAKKNLGDALVYVMAQAGVVVVDYDHDELLIGEDCRRGRIVAKRFEIEDRTSTRYHQMLLDTIGGLDAPVLLDGVMAVKGLSFSHGEDVMVDSVEAGAGGVYHARLHLDGDTAALQSFWAMQRDQEKLTGVYLSDLIGLNDSTPVKHIDFHTLLEAYYGDKLLLVVVDEQSPAIQKRLMEFLYQSKPVGCVLLTCTIPATI